MHVTLKSCIREWVLEILDESFKSMTKCFKKNFFVSFLETTQFFLNLKIKKVSKTHFTQIYHNTQNLKNICACCVDTHINLESCLNDPKVF